LLKSLHGKAKAVDGMAKQSMAKESMAWHDDRAMA
jgi:hypothetical protein